MKDQIDAANEIAAQFTEAAIKVRKEEGPAHTGFCLNCGEQSAKRWCDAVCRDEWQLTQDNRRRAL